MAAQVLPQRVYLNSFPKAGTHLAELFVRLTATPVEGNTWLGSFRGNAWMAAWASIDHYKKRVESWPAGAYYKGHCGHRPEIAKVLWNRGVVMIFVYRNLRDVVISQAYHILNTDTDDNGETHKHPGKHLYQHMPFEDVVLACINGLSMFPGIAKRWKLYAPWLDEKWILPVRYEDMRQCPRETGELIIRYVTGTTAAAYGQKIALSRKQLNDLVDGQMVLIDRHRPATFRRGKPGGWRDEWSDKIECAWHDSGAYAANQAIGYEE